MPLKDYGVLIGRPVERRLAVLSNPHYQVRVVDSSSDYRIAVNVKSKASPSEVAYLIEPHFDHPLLADLAEMALGYHKVPSRAGGVALDFIRGNLFDREAMTPLPFDVPGPSNDLNEALDLHIMRALADEDALIYAFGERWGPEDGVPDKIFGFRPGNGIHDIHMNQGNVGQWKGDNGVWQDGGLLIRFPNERQWVGIFLKFQSQGWHTDDVTGHTTTGAPLPTPLPENPHLPSERDKIIRIVAALVNPVGGDPEIETVTLLNTTPQNIALTGWKLADRMKNKMNLSGSIGPGDSLKVTLSGGVKMGNKGGQITLLDPGSLKVDGVAYSEEQARSQGWTIVF